MRRIAANVAAAAATAAVGVPVPACAPTLSFGGGSGLGIGLESFRRAEGEDDARLGEGGRGGGTCRGTGGDGRGRGPCCGLNGGRASGGGEVCEDVTEVERIE